MIDFLGHLLLLILQCLETFVIQAGIIRRSDDYLIMVVAEINAVAIVQVGNMYE